MINDMFLGQALGWINKSSVPLAILIGRGRCAEMLRWDVAGVLDRSALLNTSKPIFGLGLIYRRQSGFEPLDDRLIFRSS